MNNIIPYPDRGQSPLPDPQLILEAQTRMRIYANRNPSTPHSREAVRIYGRLNALQHKHEAWARGRSL